MSDFFSNPSNWAAIGFFVFIALVGKRAWKFITEWLDGLSNEIKNRLDEALRLREEAQELLRTYERKQREAEKDADEIIVRAKEEAARMTQESTKSLEASLERRQQLALEHIAQAEAKALKEVRDTAIDVAIHSAKYLISEELDQDKSASMIDSAINELNKKLH